MASLIVAMSVFVFGTLAWVTARKACDDELWPTLIGTLIGITFGAVCGFILVADMRQEAGRQAACEDAGGSMASSRCQLPNGQTVDFR